MLKNAGRRGRKWKKKGGWLGGLLGGRPKNLGKKKKLLKHPWGEKQAKKKEGGNVRGSYGDLVGQLTQNVPKKDWGEREQKFYGKERSEKTLEQPTAWFGSCWLGKERNSLKKNLTGGGEEEGVKKCGGRGGRIGWDGVFFLRGKGGGGANEPRCKGGTKKGKHRKRRF